MDELAGEEGVFVGEAGSDHVVAVLLEADDGGSEELAHETHGVDIAWVEMGADFLDDFGGEKLHVVLS